MLVVATAILVVLAQLFVGAWFAAQVVDRLHLGASMFAALTPLLGLLAVGVLTLLAGHVALLGPWLPWFTLAFGLAMVVLDRRRVVHRVRQTADGIRRQWLLAPISMSAVAFGLVLATLASLAPPFRVDEVQYHWAAPLEWADEGRWVDSSYRHVDSFPLMEIIFTFAATVGSYAGAHLLHLSALVGLGAAAAAGARAVGVRATGAVAAGAVAMPVIWDQAYVAYNDTVVGAFSMAAVALALRSRWSRGVMTAACILLATAISIKPTAVGAVGVVGLVILMDSLGDKPSGRVLRTVLRRWAPLIATTLAAIGFWTVRRFVLTGTWVDPVLAEPPSEDALSRMPTLVDQMVAPLMPFVLGVVGSEEPWGGRTALVLQIFLLPALMYVVWYRAEAGARFARVVIPAWTHWIVVGLQGVRTRFHIISWAMLVIGVRIALEDAAHRYPRLRTLLGAGWAAAVVLGVADSSFEMVRVIRTIDL